MKDPGVESLPQARAHPLDFCISFVTRVDGLLDVGKVQAVEQTKHCCRVGIIMSPEWLEPHLWTLVP